MENDAYDRLVQLCDSLALPAGFCLLEKRFVDVTIRYGAHLSTVDRQKKVLEIRAYFEKEKFQRRDSASESSHPEEGNFNEIQKIILGLLIFYLTALTWIIIFKFSFSAADLPHFRSINLISFGASVLADGRMDFDEIIQNLLAFIPYGLLIHILWENKPLSEQLIPVVCTSLLFEAVQFIFAVGASDITDLITNSFGGVIGIFISVGISKLSKNNWTKLINLMSFTGAVLLTLLIALLLLVNL